MDRKIDEIDEMFLKYFSQNNETPNIVEEKIKSALTHDKKSNRTILTIKKIIAIIVGFFTITGSIVFANDIKTLVLNLFKYNVGSGVNTAIENNYFQKYNLNYCESNGVRIDIDSVIMDDTNLDICFKTNLKNLYDVSSVYNIYLSNLIIKDEENRIIFAEFSNTEKYQEFCKENNLTMDYRNIAYSNGAYSSIISKKDEYDVFFTYTINSEQFPKSKKLYISFDEVILKGINKNILENYEGDWNIELELPEKFYNRDTLSYIISDSNDDNIRIIKFLISNTCTKILLQTKVDKEIVDRVYDDSLIPIVYIENEYIENEKGIKYYPQATNDGDGGHSISRDGILNYCQTFKLTQFDATENLKIVLPTYDNREIIINLKKDK